MHQLRERVVLILMKTNCISVCRADRALPFLGNSLETVAQGAITIVVRYAPAPCFSVPDDARC
jgi:hypothetical protein